MKVLIGLAIIAAAALAWAAEPTTTELRSGTWRLTFLNESRTPMPTPPATISAKIVDEATDTVVWAATEAITTNPHDLAVPDTGNALVSQTQVSTSPAGYERHVLVLDATGNGVRITDEIPFLVKRIRQLPAPTPTP